MLLPKLVAVAGIAFASSQTVPGKAFDRLAIIYFENQNYAKADGDRKSMRWFGNCMGIWLT